MGLVAGIDTLRAVAELEVDTRLETRGSLEDWSAYLLSYSGIDGAFEHHDRALREKRANDRASTQHGVEVGAVRLVDRRGNGDDKDVAAAKVLRIDGDLQLRSLEFLRSHLVRPVVAFAKSADARGADVEPDHIMLGGKRDRERKPDIAKTDDSDFHVPPKPSRQFLLVCRCPCKLWLGRIAVNRSLSMDSLTSMIN